MIIGLGRYLLTTTSRTREEIPDTSGVDGQPDRSVVGQDQQQERLASSGPLARPPRPTYTTASCIRVRAQRLE
ncbi:hypothetical protein RB213_009701 [Colletotrichum asianum]